MNTITNFLSFVIFLVFISCQSNVDISSYTLENNPSAKALKMRLDTMELRYQPVIVSGKINGYRHGKNTEELRVVINDAIKSDQVMYYNQIKEDGSFEVKIELAHPQDIMISYNRVFSIFAAPGDSVYFEFNGLTKSRPRIYNTITFGGDHAVTNTQLARYWHKYYKKRRLRALRRAQNNLDFEEYEDYMTKLHQKHQQLRASILGEMEANDTTLLFTQLDIDLDMSIRYAEYFNGERKTLTNSGKMTKVIGSMPIWKKSSMINDKLKSLVNDMHFLVPATREKILANHFEHMIVANTESINDQPLLKELVLNEMVGHAFNRYDDLSAHLNIISPYIQNPLIVDRLNKKLDKVRQHNQDPDLSNNIILDQIKDIDKDDIIQTIIDNHKDKVLFIDFWGTYCAPCIREMMVSNDMHDHYSDKSIAFIYFCVDGEERKAKWDKIVNGKGLKGNHIQLTAQQSNNLMKGIGFTGVPFYLILDKEGKLVEKGSHLRPSAGKSTIIIDKLI